MREAAARAPALMKSKPVIQLFVLARLLHASRFALCSNTL